jgi:hypothetical protein
MNGTAPLTHTHVLRVVWPILDDAMFDDEAVAAAWFDWPKFLHDYRVEPTDSPRMRVVDLTDMALTARQRTAFRKATRAVVCEAPVMACSAWEVAA